MSEIPYNLNLFIDNHTKKSRPRCRVEICTKE